MDKRRSYNCRVLNITAIITTILLLLFSSAFVLAGGNEGYFTSQDTPSHYDKLLKKAQVGGKLRIIIGLRTSLIPEGGPAEATTVQRLRISQMQESLLGSIHISDKSSVKRFKHIPFIAIEVDEDALRSLINNSMVSSIEEDKLHRPMFQYTIPLIGADSGEADQYTGVGQTIAILDTGVDKTHPFLDGKIVDEACFSTNNPTDGVTSLCPNGQTSQIGSGAGVYCPISLIGCLHGTHVAGIAAGRKLTFGDGSTIRGVAPDSTIIAIQVFSEINNTVICSLFGDPSPCVLVFQSDIINALDYLNDLRATYNIASVNISIGGGKYVTYCDNVSPSYKAAVDQLRSFGIATVIASGNDGYSDGLLLPACISSAVSVGATEYFGADGLSEQVALYSNSASFLSLLAPGGCLVNLTTCGIISSTPIEWGAWAYASGTSSAAPHVAGAWALLKQKKPSASVDEILATLQWTGKPHSDPKNGVTTPRIQVDAALAALSTNSCVAILSTNLTLHNPIILYNGQAYWADFQYTQQGLDFILTNAGLVTDTNPYNSCPPSTLSNDFRLYMPEVLYNGISYWADFQYTGGVTFTLTGAGTN